MKMDRNTKKKILQIVEETQKCNEKWSCMSQLREDGVFSCGR